jgi:hypothetical protein
LSHKDLQTQRPKHYNLLVGEAGVLRVASELALMGHATFRPNVDVGVDLIIDNDLKIQVKTSHVRLVGEYPYYLFKLNEKLSMKDGKRVRGKREKKFSEEVDFLIFWGVDENRFWIMPAKEADDKGSLYMAPLPTHPKARVLLLRKAESALQAYEGRWDLLLGAQSEPSKEQISDILNSLAS